MIERPPPKEPELPRSITHRKFREWNTDTGKKNTKKAFWGRIGKERGIKKARRHGKGKEEKGEFAIAKTEQFTPAYLYFLRWGPFCDSVQTIRYTGRKTTRKGTEKV
ncbi:unnamed protein product [Cylicostephanus goldi]|uniref:Uncharacterized protein n=1 Tax=Cylicostephanus goldi TaxID=71465 RepID=A0A3P7PNY1_CYLGO|nr:unnamed protein product [Cylicostephanus goldi]